MAKIKRPKWGNLASNLRTRIETEAKYDALDSEDFIINVYDGGKGGIFKKMSDDPWGATMGNTMPGAAPYVAGYYGTVEGETGDIVEFVNNASRTEIGVGTFPQGAKVYGVIGADLKVTITDVPGDGRAYLGTVEIPLITQGSIKIVHVCLAKDGAGFAVLDKFAAVALAGNITTAAEGDIVTGGKIMTLTLAGDTFVAADGAASHYLVATANKLIDGFMHVAGTDDLADIKTALKAAAAAGDNTAIVRTSANVLTITLPAVAGYSITTSEEIAVSVHQDLLESSSTPIIASPHATITAA